MLIIIFYILPLALHVWIWSMQEVEDDYTHIILGLIPFINFIGFCIFTYAFLEEIISGGE